MNALEQFIVMPLQQILLIGCAVAGVYWLILYDSGDGLISQTGLYQNQITQTEAELARKKQSLDRSKQFKETLRIKDEQFQAFSSFIPEELKVSDMMRVLSNEAKAAGVNIAGIQAGSAPESVGNLLTSPVAVAVQLQGPFPQHILFLSFLSRLDSIFTVSDMSFKSTGVRADESMDVDFTATIIGYRYTGNEQGKKDKKGK